MRCVYIDFLKICACTVERYSVFNVFHPRSNNMVLGCCGFHGDVLTVMKNVETQMKVHLDTHACTVICLFIIFVSWRLMYILCKYLLKYFLFLTINVKGISWLPLAPADKNLKFLTWNVNYSISLYPSTCNSLHCRFTVMVLPSWYSCSMGELVLVLALPTGHSQLFNVARERQKGLVSEILWSVKGGRRVKIKCGQAKGQRLSEREREREKREKKERVWASEWAATHNGWKVRLYSVKYRSTVVDSKEA